MSILKRLKNLWYWSGVSIAATGYKTGKLVYKGQISDFEKEYVLPKRPATIVEDELPDVFDNQEEHDTTN